jgi:hypothetical protein
VRPQVQTPVLSKEGRKEGREGGREEGKKKRKDGRKEGWLMVYGQCIQ